MTTPDRATAPVRSPMRCRRLAGALLALLPLTTLAAESHSAAQVETLARWDIAAALPDGPVATPDDAPWIEHIRSFRHAGEADRDLLLVCATLAFPEAGAGRIRAVLRYASGANGRLRQVGAPFFHGLAWARGQVPLADLCDAAEHAVGSEGSVHDMRHGSP